MNTSYGPSCLKIPECIWKGKKDSFVINLLNTTIQSISINVLFHKKNIEKGKKSEDHFEQVDHNGTRDYTIETALDKFLCGSGRPNMGIVLRKQLLRTRKRGKAIKNDT